MILIIYILNNPPYHVHTVDFLSPHIPHLGCNTHIRGQPDFVRRRRFLHYSSYCTPLLWIWSHMFGSRAHTDMWNVRFRPNIRLAAPRLDGSLHSTPHSRGSISTLWSHRRNNQSISCTKTCIQHGYVKSITCSIGGFYHSSMCKRIVLSSTVQ